MNPKSLKPIFALMSLASISFLVLLALEWPAGAKAEPTILEPAKEYGFTLSKPTAVTLQPGEITSTTITVKNTGTRSWDPESLRLYSVLSMDPSVKRTTIFVERPGILVSRANEVTSIDPRTEATFTLSLQAPSIPGNYRETFALYIDERLLSSELINWDLTVAGDSIMADKEQMIVIDKSHQYALWVEKGTIIATTLISTGLPGRYETPAGTYYIQNHYENFYSAKYGLWVEKWMGLRHETRGYEGFGLHRLPYWKVRSGLYKEGSVVNGRFYTQGKLYEDYMHLGQKRSHGCIRFGIPESTILYNWAPNGMLVQIIGK